MVICRIVPNLNQSKRSWGRERVLPLVLHRQKLERVRQFPLQKRTIVVTLIQCRNRTFAHNQQEARGFTDDSMIYSIE